MKAKPKKKRGAPKGNKNALRHGFYAELYTVSESKRLDAKLNIEDEQKAVRVLIWKMMDQLQSVKTFGEDELKTMNTLLNAATFINTVERTKILERGHGGEIAKTILEALAEMNPYEDL